MHGVQFLQTLLFAVNVERVESALQDAVVRLVMDRGRQPQPGADSALFPIRSSAPSEHLPAPGGLRVFTKRFENTGGRLLFQPLQDQGGGFGGPALRDSGAKGSDRASAVATVNWFVIDRGLVPWMRTHGQENTDRSR